MTAETVANRTYPLVRDAFVYINRAPGRPIDPKVKEFLRFILSREGQQIIADTDMYNPLTVDELRRQLQKLN
jgi:phosphate transport system substrate-binding protein